MNAPYDNTPPLGDFIYIPKGKANCQVNEIFSYQGETFRNPIGKGWTATELKSPIIAETMFGVFEIVNIPRAEDCGIPAKAPIAPGAEAHRETRTSTTVH